MAGEIVDKYSIQHIVGLQMNSAHAEIISTHYNKWDKSAVYLHTCAHMYTCVCILTYMHTHKHMCVSTCTLVCSQPYPRKEQETLPSSLRVSALLESLTQELDWLQSVRSGLVPREGQERVCLGYNSLVITCCRGQPRGSFCQGEAWAGAGSILPACASPQ